MRIECLHGYFRFTEEKAGELSQFVSKLGLELKRRGDHFTFEGLAEAPTHSIAGGTYLGADCSVTFEGEPWEVMRANRLVFNFLTGEVVSLDDVDQAVEIKAAGNYSVTTGMLLPGSVIEDGSRVTDYAAFYFVESNRFQYSEIAYE
jgi:hypothetical protein